ncbi:hypothetical protein ACFL1B_04795 [Nanoarchaeota archaeon]
MVSDRTFGVLFVSGVIGATVGLAALMDTPNGFEVPEQEPARSQYEATYVSAVVPVLGEVRLHDRSVPPDGIVDAVLQGYFWAEPQGAAGVNWYPTFVAEEFMDELLELYPNRPMRELPEAAREAFSNMLQSAEEGAYQLDLFGFHNNPVQRDSIQNPM